ncbi:uncharacterized protein LOC130731185 [Lotus japonicus]|uniref:uncharacterized protein LOC130731185 n=1 Tax=Lotus japonicus TaxID=34305 RepID=UPI0025883CA0|nr:uncharacterized protein LOC130731185 [Lotus japonicus]
MTYGRFSLLLTRRFSLSSLNPKSPFFLKPYSTIPDTTSNQNNPKPSSLSARLSFVFDQIDVIEKERSQKHDTLQRIRAWRESKTAQNDVVVTREQPVPPEPTTPAAYEVISPAEVTKKEVELVHPWPEWIQLMERLVHQNYFDHKRTDEDKMVQDLGFEPPKVVDDAGLDFTKDLKSVLEACLNFGRDRFDILRSLSRQDIQILVGFGCPTVDKRVVFSSKVLRKHVHLDEGDVCSSCILRNTCEKAYLLTNKEDEARTIDVMRLLLTFGFDPINGSVVNKSLLKQKSVRTVVRKLLHEVVKLSSVPIDPNLSPPVFKKPPPKVKQPPPPPKRRVGRDDIEMKKGDWLCPKCDFMNFAKNNACLQCDAKRPKRQLLPGEWECPQCNFLNYRRNVVCFHCECKRPPDEFLENKMQDRNHSPKPKFDKMGSRQEVSNAWNFDFDDNESDGADVAAFEYADAHAIDEDFPSDNNARRGNYKGREDDFEKNGRLQGSHDGEYANPDHSRPRIGFDDFEDEDDIDSYELETQNSSTRMEPSKNNISETEDYLESEDSDDTYDKILTRDKTATGRSRQNRSIRKNTSYTGSKGDKLDFDSDEELSVLSNFKSSHVSAAGQKRKDRGPTKKLSFGSESDVDVGAGLYSDEDDDLNESYASRKNKGNKFDPSRQSQGSGRDSGRRNFTRDWGSGSSGGRRADMLSDDDFDGPSSYRNGDRRSGSRGGRRADMLSDDDFDGSSQQSYRNGRGGRGSRGNDRNSKSFEDFDGSSRQSYRNGRGGSRGNDRNFEDFDGSSRQSYRNGRGGSRGNDRNFEDFDGSSRKSYRNGGGSRGNDRNFDGSSRQSFRGGRGSRGNGRGRKSFDDFDGSSRQSYRNGRGSQGNDRPKRRFEDREHGTRHFDKYSKDEKGAGEFRNSRRVIER